LSISFNTPDCLIVTIGTVCENQDTSPSVMQQEMNDYIRNLQKNDDGTDPDFEDLSSEYSK
ncbi:hypothetical protein ACK3YN_10355, partial [Aeromonas caviae]